MIQRGGVSWVNVSDDEESKSEFEELLDDLIYCVGTAEGGAGENAEEAEIEERRMAILAMFAGLERQNANLIESLHDAGELVKDIIAEKNKFINGVLDIAKILQDRHDKTN